MASEFAISEHASPVGNLRLAATRHGLLRIALPRHAGRGFMGAIRTVLSDPQQVDWLPALDKAAQQLDAYFRGSLRRFDLDLDLRGTEFQRRVWAGLQQIPYGATCCYAELAGAIGHPRAHRAVGAANGANPLSIIVPCHRVIRADGRLGGYGGGLEAKRRLLALEKAQVSDLI